MIPEAEPGTPLIITGLMSDGDGKPIEGAIIYAYQTDAKGNYSDGLVAAANGLHDDRHPRLFAFARTGPDGRYELRTIRPAAYSDAPDNPEHIHFAFGAKGYRSTRPRANINMYFADDPRLTGEAAEEIRSDKAHLVTPTRDADGTQRCEYDLILSSESPSPKSTTQAAAKRVRVGMKLEDARAILAARGAKEDSPYQLISLDPGESVTYFKLPDGAVLELCFDRAAGDQSEVKRMFISTYKPKSWNSKIDPEARKVLQVIQVDTGVHFAVVHQARRIPLSFTTVFQFRPDPDTPSVRSITAFVSFDVPIPAG